MNGAEETSDRGLPDSSVRLSVSDGVKSGIVV